MRTSLPEPVGVARGSAFEDFLSRLRPYPPPPSFDAALLLAAAGSLLTPLAAGAAAILPSGDELRGDGFHAVGVDTIASALDLYGTLALPLLILGLVMLIVTMILVAHNRPTALANCALIVLPVLGVASIVSVGFGWLLLLTVTMLNLLLWLAAVVLLLVGLGIVLRGDLITGLSVALLAIALATTLEVAASPPSEGASAAGTAQPSGMPPWMERREREQQEAERRRHQRAKMQGILGGARQRLERRMDAEYAAWLRVPYAAPCDESTRRAELQALRDQFSAMVTWLWKAQRNGANGRFLRVKKELKRVAQERRRALTAPRRFHYLYGVCPSPAGALDWEW